MKMTQPELGRKIADLRKARGFTQEQLVEKCNLSVRTLQRIESGEVIPRSHTIKVIFEALEYDLHISAPGPAGKFFGRFKDLFNLKTNTMKKVSALTGTIAVIALALILITPNTKAQSAPEIQSLIEANTGKFITWFNTGQIDSLVSFYRDDACLLTVGCGKTTVRAHYLSLMEALQYTRLQPVSVSVSDSIAVEKGEWTIRLRSGQTISGEYLTEWRLTGNKWLIVNDISSNY